MKLPFGFFPCCGCGRHGSNGGGETTTGGRSGGVASTSGDGFRGGCNGGGGGGGGDGKNDVGGSCGAAPGWVAGVTDTASTHAATPAAWSDAGASDAAAVGSVGSVGFPIASFRVASCSSSTRVVGRRPIVHACLGRNMYLVWASPREEVPSSLAVFLNKSPSCVRLGRESGALRLATAADLGDTAATNYDRLHDRLLFVRGEEQSAAPAGGGLSVIELVLVAPSAGVCQAWAGVGDSLVLPWPVLLSLGRAGGESPAAAVRSLVGSMGLMPLGASKRGAVSAALGARGRRAVLQASHWLQPLMDNGTVDQVSGIRVVGPALRMALLVVQSTALAVLADAHRTLRVVVLERSTDLAGRMVALVYEALARDQTAITTAHAAQLCEVLCRVEAVLDAVEATFFAHPAKTMLEEGVVRSWMEQLEQINKELVEMCVLGAVGYEIDSMAARALLTQRTSPSSGNNEQDISDSVGQDTSIYQLRWHPPSLDATYVPGVDNPDRVEHAIVTALQARRTRANEAPRIGVCAVGGSGKTTACAGVASCEWVRARITKGTAWVQLDASSTLQSVAEAVMALVYRFCGDDVAKQLAALMEDEDFVRKAAGYVRSAPVADADEWLVVIDDVLHEKRDLLRQLLVLIPPATPVLFSTRSEAVVASVPGAMLMSIDALPAEDARLVLAKAAGSVVAAGMPALSTAEDTCWVDRVLAKTQCHALSLAIVGSMIGDRGGAWRPVVEALEQRWMDPGFSCSDSDSPRPSVRATLDVSLELLPDGVCRDAFAAVGVLPSYVRLPVLARLWRPLLERSAAACAPLARQLSDVLNVSVERLVDELVRAGLLRRDVNKTCGELVGVNVHPVVGHYALSLLGDAARSTHQRIVDAYLDGVVADGLDAHGWQRFPFWDVPDDGYWYDHVVRHVVAARNVCGLVSVMDPEWKAVRVRVSSPLAFHADVELVLPALTAMVDDTASKATWSPVLLGRVHAALALAYSVRFVGSWRANTEVAIMHWDKALALVNRLEVPTLWADWQAGRGRAYRVRISGARAANIEEAIACYHRALEVRTREAAPLAWAETKSNLGGALVDRVTGDKAAHIESAIACYKDALTVRTREAAPDMWASTKNSLGAAYRRRVQGDKAANVEAAITCYNLALEVHTRPAAPLLWARIRYNLGIAYYDRLVGDKASSIEYSIACYKDALTVRTREATPLKWAATQNHLGKALRDRLFGDPEANLAAATACFERALTVRTREAVPLNWAETQHNMGVTHHSRIKAGATGTVNVDAAVACFRRAIEVRTPEAAPQEWALTAFFLLQALIDGQRWSEAVECGRALEQFGPRWAAWPAQQAAVVSALARTEHALA